MIAALWSFQGTFRRYQQRILDAAEPHEDYRTHIVAAPGSGKTILGLEISGRLGRPVLVLSPSLAIRDQWISRLHSHFAIHDQGFLTTTSLRSSATLVSTTYQGLYSAYTRGADEESGESFADVDIVEAMAGIGTIILDEAHHLRAQWHKALVGFIDALKERNAHLNIIALTATPPYDSSALEWAKYLELCGDIDEEISTPELVETGDLCPHQDYVYINEPSEEERQELLALRQRVIGVIHTLGAREDFPGMLAASPLMSAPEQWVDDCLDDERGCVGYLRLLDLWGCAHPPVLEHLFAGGAEAASVEDGLNFIITHPALFSPGCVDAVSEALHSERLIRANRLINTSDLQANALIVRSAGKLTSIGSILVHEARALGDSLRALVLLDHIRPNYQTVIGSDAPLAELGAVPAFEAIRRALVGQAEHVEQQMGTLALLTGSLVILPRRILPWVEARVADQGSTLSYAELPSSSIHSSPHERDYVRVTFSAGSKTALKVLTQAVNAGVVTILVGTASLLGEGWDCPVLNTLVLGSTVKTTMLSNQMRGRVIRSDPAAPHKVANIWHLGTTDPDRLLTSGAQEANPLESFDMYSLARRCDTFVGPRMTEPVIESGIERCLLRRPQGLGLGDLPSAPPGKFVVDEHNAKTLTLSHDRIRVAQLWKEAIARGAFGNLRVAQELRLDVPLRGPKILAAPELIIALIVIIFGFFSPRLVEGLFRSGAHSVGVAALCVILGLSLAWAWGLRDRMLKPHRRISAQVRAVIAALNDRGAIDSPDAFASLTDCADFQMRVHVHRASSHDEQTIMTAISELYSPVRNPRYLLLPNTRLLPARIFMAQNVPKVLAGHKDDVEAFVRALGANGLRMEAVFVRSVEGRQQLLRARKYAATNRAVFAHEKRRTLIASSVYAPTWTDRLMALRRFIFRTR